MTGAHHQLRNMMLDDGLKQTIRIDLSALYRIPGIGNKTGNTSGKPS